MLFAAGFGTRMGALTAAKPKPLLTLGGQTLIDRALDIADAAGIENKVVNLHYLGDQIAGHLTHRPGIALAWERAEILETGGGLRAALPLLGKDPVYTLNPDAVFAGANPLIQLRNAWDGAKMDALLMLLPMQSVKGRDGPADFAFSRDGRIIRADTTGSVSWRANHSHRWAGRYSRNCLFPKPPLGSDHRQRSRFRTDLPRRLV